MNNLTRKIIFEIFNDKNMKKKIIIITLLSVASFLIGALITVSQVGSTSIGCIDDLPQAYTKSIGE